ncbi:MAG TPA: GTP cyclohydrolase II [Anaeromyxobacteraceae bacterium]|nr:GTP cyclohydrolase II [Anaeromyxobacteraceae bacterium]
MNVGGDALRALVERDRDHECDGLGAARVCVRVVAVARLPTRFGNFELVGFWNNRDAKEHVAMVHGDVVGASDVPVRVHSECLTGDVMGSLRCDCRDQLTEGLRTIAAAPRGVLLYLRQEGRGIGLLNKIRAYALQEQGLDTVEANEALGFRDDERDYAVAAHMLRSLSIRSVDLITNNPEKIRQLTQHGVNVAGRIPHVIPPNDFNRFYLETKARRSGHLIDVAEKRLAEQSDPVIVEGMPGR